MRLTSVEFTGRTAFFQPSRVLGLLLSVLLVGRIVWRLSVGSTNATLGWNFAEFVRNPSTMLLFGLFVAHYMAYAVGLVYWVQKSPHFKTIRYAASTKGTAATAPQAIQDGIARPILLAHFLLEAEPRHQPGLRDLEWHKVDQPHES